MGFLRTLLDLVLSLFGLKKKEPALASGSYSEEERQRIRNQSVRGLDEVEGAEHIHVFGTSASSRVVRSEKGADLVEEDGKQQWVERVDTDVPRERWVDEWGPLSGPTALEDFAYHEHWFDKIRSGDPLAAEQKLKSFGYQSVGHFFYVRNTIVKYFATPMGPNLGDAVFQSQEYMSAVMRAHQRALEDESNATMAANPELLAPVEGVTLELYAAISAKQGQGLTQDALLQILAQNGLDYPAWDRAQREWTDRMGKDTTGSLARKFTQAFMSQGQGQFGAAGQAAAATAWNGAAAGGPEPVPFETLCEIAGAMSAWAKTGQDVNALLQQRFGMNASDYGNMSSWWFTQMTADLRKLDEYNTKMAQYEQRYMGPVVRHDADIAF